MRCIETRKARAKPTGPKIMVTVGIDQDDWHWLQELSIQTGLPKPRIIRDLLKGVKREVCKHPSHLLGEKL